MTTAEKVELALIACSIFGIYGISSILTNVVSLSTLVLWSSALLLFQGLLRDLYLLSQLKQGSSGSQKKQQAICLESTVGLTGILIGILLLALNIHTSISMQQWPWSLLAFAVLGIGFLIKDLIIEWKPLKIKRDKNHLNIIFSLRA